MEASVWTLVEGWGSGRNVKKFHDACLVGEGVGQDRWVPASMSLGHALDWEELAAGERPG